MLIGGEETNPLTNFEGARIFTGTHSERRAMTTTVKISEAKTHLSDLLVRAEAGEDIIIARGNDPIIRLARIAKETDMQLLLAEVRAARQKAAASTHDEVLSWRDEGRR
nr:type II toxin-antitoxin system prevent-host-death family antitoxin [Rhizobium sp. TCK]